MKQLLIVAPHFPPVNAADMHRARVSLPYFREFGWQPHVIAVAAEHQGEMAQDDRLLETVPSDVPVTRTSAAPLWLTRKLGVGNVGLRALAPLYRAGAKCIRQTRIDLAYFSTTVFASMALGPIWKRRYGVPFVLDMQDPWVSDYRSAGASRHGKHALAARLHEWLEPFTMRSVDGLVSVSPAYIETLRARYPQIAPELCATIPFGASGADFDVARRLPGSTSAGPTRAGGDLQAVSVGRGGADLAPAATILFRAIAALRSGAGLPSVRFSFVGTDYAPAGQGRRSIAPVADGCGVGDLVVENPARVPYFEALRRLVDADLLLVLGSDDPQYSPSKVYPYLLARRPIVAILHETSPVVALLRRAGSLVVTFTSAADVDDAARRLAPALASLLGRLPFQPDLDDSVLAPFSARELTRQQCALFDAVLDRRAAQKAVPCLG